jgi:glutathione transport system substrate-binding protein
VPPEMIKLLQNSPTLAVFNEPSINILYVVLNNMRKPFDDLRVRLA